MRIYKRNDSPNWWATWTGQNGKRYRRSSGTSNRKQAEALASKWVQESYLEQHFGTKPEVAFSEALLRYANAQKRERPKHFMSVTRYILRRHSEYFGGLNLSEVTAASLRGYIDLRMEQVSIGTVQRDISVVRAILNKAHREELIDKVPPFPQLRTPKARNVWLTERDVDRLVSHSAKHLKPIVLVAVDTGGRLSELLGLDWRQVNLANGRVTFVETKNGDDRTVPLCERALRVIASLGPQDSGPVFTFRGKRMKTLGTSFPCAREAAGLPHVHFHDLRHTYASRLVQGGVSLYDVMHLMGHKSLRMVQRYAHLAPDYQKGALKVLNRPQNPIGHNLGTVADAPEMVRPVKSPISMGKNGAGDEIRTHDFNLGKVALYP